MQRQLPVAASRVNGAGITIDHRAQRIESTEPRRRVRVKGRAALDEEIVQAAVVVEDTEAPRPPMAALVDIGAGLQQHVNHFAITLVDRREQRRSAKRRPDHFLVELRLQLRELIENILDVRRRVRPNRRRKRLRARLCDQHQLLGGPEGPYYITLIRAPSPEPRVPSPVVLFRVPSP